jgi:hypothetical protein
MSLTQSMKIARSYIHNAQAMLSDSMQSECPDPDYSLFLAESELGQAIEYIREARAIRQGFIAEVK